MYKKTKVWSIKGISCNYVLQFTNQRCHICTSLNRLNLNRPVSIVTDNASNMVKAFDLPGFETDETEDESGDDDLLDNGEILKYFWSKLKHC